jgi:hypothetical protein
VRFPLLSPSSVSRARSSVKITVALLMKYVYYRKADKQSKAAQLLMLSTDANSAATI